MTSLFLSLKAHAQSPTELLNTFMTAITQPDATTSAQAILPLLHASLKSPDGTTLSKDVQQFSFQKARKDAPFYKNPVEIVRENKFDQKSINLGKNPEEGTLIDYYLARKDPSTGMPAPVRVFFPANGGKPVITYIGSL